ncbi:MAG: radical SAM family heme chaperone HemW [Actinomycetia bacterium]|nr:radical SAM family heme chaperone HemW [Actinomycetes bacterium]
MGVYVHVPYCQTRCGYCDFNTFVPGESGRGQPSDWARSASAEIELRSRELGPFTGPVDTVFFGGGTPTLLPAKDLGMVLEQIAAVWGIASDAEITTEANPETIEPGMLKQLLAVGFNRLSIGMQSADQAVLRTLDRSHTPGGSVTAAHLAHMAGFAHISLDLIYGTPGETLSSWEGSIEAALAAPVDHTSAYGLKVESGTRLARRIRRGEVPAVNDDYAADAYQLADQMFADAGLHWYEISNWARPGGKCHHNLGYWQGADWLGIGPGAHGTTRGLRYWNEKLPARWAARIAEGLLPTAGTEHLTPDERLTETVMLSIRLSTGLRLLEVGLAPQDPMVRGLVDQGLAERSTPTSIRLTRSGRLLADMVTLRLLERLDALAADSGHRASQFASPDCNPHPNALPGTTATA